MRMVQKLADDFKVLTGLSDHTMGAIVPIVSVCFGAKIIEKHFILDRSIGGPDASFSMNEAEFKEMVIAVRQAESAMGIESYELTEKQKAGKVFSRSLYISKDIKKGDVLDGSSFRSVRPGLSIHPKYFDELLGKKALKDFTLGDRIKKEDVE
jgi:pseudaminic acid synthase